MAIPFPRVMQTLLVAMAAALTQPVAAQTPSVTSQRSTEQLLQDFIDDYRMDPMAMTADFGIKVGSEWWNVSVRQRQQAFANGKLTGHRFGPHEVVLRPGPPAIPTWYFDLADRSVLERIASGEINAATGAMQSFSSDKVMVETGKMDGYAGGTKGDAQMYHALAHFWNRGTPEIVYFSRDKALPTHGVAAVSIDTSKPFRIGWFSMGKNDVANADAALEAGEVPNLFIITKGRGRAKLGDREYELREGMSIFVAPYVRHVLWNPNDEPMEGILVLYGDNRDAVFGKSYIDVQQGLHDFYGSFPFRSK